MNREARYYRDLDDGFIFNNDWQKTPDRKTIPEGAENYPEENLLVKHWDDFLLAVLFIASFLVTLFILGYA